MNDQPNDQATKKNPGAERQPNVLNEENWSAQKYPDIGIPPLQGYLQLCADRRFHRCLQEQFQKNTGINSPQDYWIHADAGGTPKMECQRTAPDYCYYKMEVRLMGWSAHGDNCGGFGDNVPDSEIRRALLVTARRKIEDYPLASHYVYFATTEHENGESYAVVYCLICAASAD